MQLRYSYRLCPDAAQREALARAFGCARVVYNECLRLRDACHAAGEKISDTEVQRQVVTVAKLTPERAWLAEVASVALVQACQDARRAYRNWFDSLAGKRKGRKVGRPGFRRKHRRQSIRLTGNGFSFHGERLHVAKVGDVTERGVWCLAQEGEELPLQRPPRCASDGSEFLDGPAMTDIGMHRF